LPPYNCDMNPIEYVWKDIKHEVTNSNLKLIKFINEYTANQRKKPVTRVKRQ